ncbi:MAG: hypothetical protein ABIP53_10030 [Candidatus Limnocylindrales bacterium]
MSVIRGRRTQLRLLWAALLVLVALGAAGLAVAADRPHNPVQRPEITWQADHEATPWLNAMALELGAIDADVVKVSDAGRAVLGSLQSLATSDMTAAIADGDAAAAAMDDALDSLAQRHAAAITEIEEWRIGPDTYDKLSAVETAADSAREVPGIWNGLATEARRVASLVDALLRHDGLVFRATTAGRQSNWDYALSLLDQANGPLSDVVAIRNSLAATVDVATLDDLLTRDRNYDSALTALYSYIRSTDNQSGDAFDALMADVDAAQDALPADTSAMSVIVSEAAGRSLTQSLIAIEEVHGAILEALAAVAPTDATP